MGEKWWRTSRVVEGRERGRVVRLSGGIVQATAGRPPRQGSQGEQPSGGAFSSNENRIATLHCIGRQLNPRRILSTSCFTVGMKPFE